MNSNITLLAVILIFCSTSLLAGDWPTWRHDAARSAASLEEIPDKPVLKWSRQLPTVRPAWPLDREHRLNFDMSYEPVVMGKLLFLGSPNDGSITAYDTDSGEKKWQYFTEGPVRCAPACWGNKIYAGSDDGYLYCLDAETGKLLWKVRGAPKDRPHKYQLGNGHLVSLWPVRGGPVVTESGTVCFAAGVWSIFGVFVHCVDAATGEFKWTNSDLKFLLTRAGGMFVESGVSPQGYLVAVRDRLIVPNGRAMPAGLDLETGKIIYHLRGTRGGDSRIAAYGDYGFVGKTSVVNLYDFREVGSKWAYKGDKPPKGYFDSPAWRDWTKYGFGLYESCFTHYKLIPACDAYSSLADGVSYGLAKGEFYAYDLSKPKITESKLKSDHGPFMGLKWEPPLIWKFKTPYPGRRGNIVIKAGKRLYGGVDKNLLAVENIDGEPRIAWEKKLHGRATSIIAADKKLFVATKDRIYCFGAGSLGKKYDYKPVKLETKKDSWTRKTSEILSTTRRRAGYCLVLGLQNGHLIEELLKKTKMVIIAVDPDSEKIESLRRGFDAAGMLGSRVELFQGKPFEFLFPPYMANLIASENPQNSVTLNKSKLKSLFNILRPYGGTMCFEMTDKDMADFDKRVKSANLAKGEFSQKDNWLIISREGSLPGSAPWTHQEADPAGTLCSQDDLVRAPLGVLWYGDMNKLVLWRKIPLKSVVNSGVVFVPKPHSKSVEVLAYDAFTGRHLWGINMKSITRGSFRFAAMDEGLYVAMDGQCKLIDSETGKILKTFTFDKSGVVAIKGLYVEDDCILISCSEFREKIKKEHLKRKPNDSIIVCLDRKTGKELWRRLPKNRSNNSPVVTGDGLMFSIDSVLIEKPEKTPKNKKKVEEFESSIFALDLRTGKEKWRAKIPRQKKGKGKNHWLKYSAKNGMVLGGKRHFACAWDAKTGSVKWEKKWIWSGPVVLLGDTFLAFERKYAGTGWAEISYDIHTGNPTKKPSVLHGFGCNTPIASKHLLTQRVEFGSASYIDLDKGKLHTLRNIRPGCNNAMIAADGLLNVPSMALGCWCSYSLLTSFAMATMPEVTDWAGSIPLKLTPPPPLPEKKSYKE